MSSIKVKAKTTRQIISEYVGTDKWKLDAYIGPDFKPAEKQWVQLVEAEKVEKQLELACQNCDELEEENKQLKWQLIETGAIPAKILNEIQEVAKPLREYMCNRVQYPLCTLFIPLKTVEQKIPLETASSLPKLRQIAEANKILEDICSNCMENMLPGDCECDCYYHDLKDMLNLEQKEAKQ